MKELGIFLGEERLGLVRVESVRGKEVFAFAYDGAWLKSGNVPTIDPDVVASAGEQFPVGKEMFGFLADIAPDRWGRRLIRRKEVQLARREKRPERTLLASDFIVGAYDLTRTGAVRVMLDGKFVSSDSSKPAPPWTTLRTLEDELGKNGQLSLSLAQVDFTTATRVANAINAAYGGIARAANPGRIDIRIPPGYRSNVVGFVASIESLPVKPDNVARVVFSERTGTIVMGGEVTVDECAITQGGLSIKVQRSTDVYQPNPLSYGTTMVTSSEDTAVDEEGSNSIVLPPTTNVSDIVGALNAVGATPRDCISILQAMKAAGAIHAVLEII